MRRYRLPYAFLVLLAIPAYAFAGQVSLFPRQLDATGLTAIQADPAGNIYIAGAVTPSNAQTDDGSDAFVMKLSADGSQVYKTVLAGSARDIVSAIALATDGSLYLAGSTSSDDFPTTSGALQPTLGDIGSGEPQSGIPC